MKQIPWKPENFRFLKSEFLETWYTNDAHENCPILKTSIHLVHQRTKLLLHVIRSFLQDGFRFTIIHIFSIHFAIKLFYHSHKKRKLSVSYDYGFICTTWKHKQTMEQQPQRACERTKSKQKQNQVTSQSYWPHVLLLILPSSNATVSLKDGFTVWHQSEKEDFNVLFTMMSVSWSKSSFLWEKK